MTLSEGLQIGAIVSIAFLLTRLSRPVLVRILRIVAKRSIDGGDPRWQNRIPRLLTENSGVAELRRQQRIEATALGLSRVSNIGIWTLAVILALEAANIDPVFAISAAGFIGVALAIGGQNAVNDFVTGLQFLIEDRLGQGDSVRISVHDDVVECVVGSLGAFSTRFETKGSTIHLANRELTMIVNLSQHGVSGEVPLPVNGGPTGAMKVELRLRDLYRASPGFDGAVDGLVIDRVVRRGKARVALIRTARSITEAQLAVLSRDAAD